MDLHVWVAVALLSSGGLVALGGLLHPPTRRAWARAFQVRS